MKIFSSNKLSQELKLIKKLASWNDFPKYIVNTIFRKTLRAHEDKSEPNLTAKQKEPVVIYFQFPYYGDERLQLLKSCILKMKVNCKNDEPIVFKVLYDVCTMNFFCNNKDRTTIINQSFVVYEFSCPGWGANYGVIKTVLQKIASTSVLKCSTYLRLPIYVQHCFQMTTILRMLIIKIHVSI